MITEGRCLLNTECPELRRSGLSGHALPVRKLTLCHNRDFTDWWLASDCAPNERQPIYAGGEEMRLTLQRLKSWRETVEILAAEGALQIGMRMPV